MENKKNNKIDEILKESSKEEPKIEEKEIKRTPAKKEEPKNDERPAWAIAMEDKISKLSEENAMLKDMAGKNAIKSYEEGNKKKENSKAFFKIWNDKMVIGWEKLDYSKFNPKAPNGLMENILTTVIFEDGEKEVVNYVAFNNSTDRAYVEIIKKTGDLSTVVLPSGKELTIETKFLNF